MTVVHVFGNHVPDLTEGVSRNVSSLVDALRGLRVDARLTVASNSLAAMNRRTRLLAGSLRASRLSLLARSDRGVHLVHHHVSLASLAGPLRLGHGRGPPVLLHVWNALHEKGTRGRGATLQRLANGPATARLALARTRHLVVSSRFQANQMEGLGISAQVHVVPNGVDTDLFRPAAPRERHAARQALGLGDGPVLLYYGHLSPWKGVDVLLSSLPTAMRGNYLQALLSVTSYGGDPDALRRRLQGMGLAHRSQVHPTTHVPTLHHAADFAVLPARAAVGTACHPNVLLECMAAGLAVVTTRVGSIPEVVEHERNGILVPPDDPVALAAALRRLAADAELRRRLGEAARRTVLDRFRWDDVASRMQGVYAEVLAGNPPPPRIPLPSAVPMPVLATPHARSVPGPHSPLAHPLAPTTRLDLELPR